MHPIPSVFTNSYTSRVSSLELNFVHHNHARWDSEHHDLRRFHDGPDKGEGAPPIDHQDGRIMNNSLQSTVREFIHRVHKSNIIMKKLNMN
jgi:hypothetical protein